MEKTIKPLARKGKGVKKLWIVFTFILVLFSLIVSYGYSKYRIGYDFYENNSKLGTAQTNYFDKVVLADYLDELQENHYIVKSISFSGDIDYNWKFIKRGSANESQLKDTLKQYVDVKILVYQLTIPNDDNVYCFKNEEDLNIFIEKLKQYVAGITTTIHEVVGKIEDISNEEMLNKKIQELDEAKKAAEKAAAAAKRKKTTSRSSNSGHSVKSNYSVIASYVYISSYYGMRHGKMHTGVDLAASKGTYVYAWKGGKVIQASWNSQGYGNFIIIEHDDGTTSRYAHLSGYAISKDDVVVAGQLIGYVGSTGNSTGPHLHFEILVNGAFVNPLNYL